MVKIRENWAQIRTLIVRTEQPKSNYKQRIPIVLLHGMGAGVGLWLKNLDSLAEQRPVYTLDILGFGRSSRVPFPKDPVASEVQLVDSIEEWREQLGLQKFVLLGHSMGGFLACSYALRFPNRVAHLVLADPWGFPEKPPDAFANLSPLIRGIARAVTYFNPLSVIRVAGPFGPNLISRFRHDLRGMYEGIIPADETDMITDYIYHCNAQCPSGESAFKEMSAQLGYAKYPMIRRAPALDTKMPVTFIYGGRSWMDPEISETVKELRGDHTHTEIEVVGGAGHHVYAQRALQFNALVNRICLRTDIGEGIMRNDASEEQLTQVLEEAKEAEMKLPPARPPRRKRRVVPPPPEADSDGRSTTAESD